MADLLTRGAVRADLDRALLLSLRSKPDHEPITVDDIEGLQMAIERVLNAAHDQVTAGPLPEYDEADEDDMVRKSALEA